VEAGIIVTFWNQSSPTFARIDNAGAPVVATEIKRSNKAGGASADDQTIQHV
jgi:hypothetical protein